MSEPGGDPSSGISSGDALILPERHPACSRREARPGFRTERSAEGYERTSDGNGTTAPIGSKNCDSVVCRSSTRRLLPARRPVSAACPDIPPSNRPCATRISTASVSPTSMFLPRLNPIEPSWYGPVCPVVWEGWRREGSPYPDPGQRDPILGDLGRAENACDQHCQHAGHEDPVKGSSPADRGDG